MGMATIDFGSNGYLGPTTREQILEEVSNEVNRAVREHGFFHSYHEAYGVLVEEVYEFFDEVKLKAEYRDPERAIKELIQVAAVAVKTIHCIRENFQPDGFKQAIVMRDHEIDRLRSEIANVAKAIGYDE